MSEAEVKLFFLEKFSFFKKETLPINNHISRVDFSSNFFNSSSVNGIATFYLSHVGVGPFFKHQGDGRAAVFYSKKDSNEINEFIKENSFSRVFAFDYPNTSVLVLFFCFILYIKKKYRTFPNSFKSRCEQKKTNKMHLLYSSDNHWDRTNNFMV